MSTKVNALQSQVMKEMMQHRNLQAHSLEDIAKRNGKYGEVAWVLIDGLVYDVTKFHKFHPGGSLLLLRYAGTDATADFKMMHADSVLKRPHYAKLLVGRLAIEGLAPQDQAKLLKSKIKERWLPHTEPYWMDPRGTFPSPFMKDHHKKWQLKVRKFVQTELEPNAGAWDEKGEYPLDLHRKAYDAGIYGACWPKEYGGTPPEGGWDLFMDFILHYELARCGSGGLFASLFFTANIALPPILHHGTPEMKRTVVPDIIKGNEIIALAVTEPWGGSDVANLRATAVDAGDHFVVNGEKKFITSGQRARYFTTAVRTDPSKTGMGSISLLLIDRGFPGVTTRKIKTQGWWAGNTSYITFEDVKVPKANLIGKLNHGFKYVMENFNHERFAACVMTSSACHGLIAEAIKFARVRRTFGKRLIDHQAIRMKIAEMVMRSEAHFALVEQLTYHLSQGVPHLDIAPKIAMCKVNGTRLHEFCSREASQILGGNSYARGGHGERVERSYREVRINAIGGGSEEVMLDVAMRMSNL